MASTTVTPVQSMSSPSVVQPIDFITIAACILVILCGMTGGAVIFSPAFRVWIASRLIEL